MSLLCIAGLGGLPQVSLPLAALDTSSQEALESVAGLVAPVLEVRVRHRRVAELAGPLANDQHLLRLRIGKRPQQRGLDEAEQRGVGADGEGQGRDGSERIRWRAAERSQREADVVEERFHRRFKSQFHASVVAR